MQPQFRSEGCNAASVRAQRTLITSPTCVPTHLAQELYLSTAQRLGYLLGCTEEFRTPVRPHLARGDLKPDSGQPAAFQVWCRHAPHYVPAG